VEPMLASAVVHSLPDGPGWAFEVKWDGVRVLADTRSGRVRLRSRSGRDVTTTYPELEDLGGIQGAVLDGEVVSMHQGGPSFEALSERMGVSDATRARALADRSPVTYMVFDVLVLYGVDLTRHPYRDRRAALERLTLPEHCALSPRYDDGPSLWEATREHGLEGVVAKRLDSPYQAGQRSPDWLKAAHRSHRAARVCGWRGESTGSGRLASLLLGAPDAEGRLRFLGRAGSGIGDRLASELTRRLGPLE
jgi:bifunctional non-homologous end joining protein LigD